MILSLCCNECLPAVIAAVRRERALQHCSPCYNVISIYIKCASVKSHQFGECLYLTLCNINVVSLHRYKICKYIFPQIKEDKQKILHCEKLNFMKRFNLNSHISTLMSFLVLCWYYSMTQVLLSPEFKV